MAPFEAFSTDAAPKPVANYSQAAKAGPFVFLAGQGGFHPETGQLVGSDIASQTERTLLNLGAVLEAAGLTFADIVSIRYFITDHSLFSGMNEVHARFFHTAPFPVRTTVTAGLAPGMLVEIDAIAYVGD